MIGFLVFAYLVVAVIINWKRHGSVQSPTKEIIAQLFDGSLFAGSVVLLMGVFEPSVLAEIGNTKPFLLIAGAAGVIYPLVALCPPPTRNPKKKRHKPPEIPI